MRAVPLTHSCFLMLWAVGRCLWFWSFGHIPNILVALSLLPLRIDTSDLVALWDSLPKQTVGGEIRSHLVKGQTALLSLETQSNNHFHRLTYHLLVNNRARSLPWSTWKRNRACNLHPSLTADCLAYLITVITHSRAARAQRCGWQFSALCLLMGEYATWNVNCFQTRSHNC